MSQSSLADLGSEERSRIANRGLQVTLSGVEVARDEVALHAAVNVGAHLVQERLRLGVGLLTCLLEELVRKVGAILGRRQILRATTMKMIRLTSNMI